MLEKEQQLGWVKTFLGLALVLQVALATYISYPWLTSDSLVYLQLAEALNQGFYGWDTEVGREPDTLRPPGYPILLWMILHVLQLPVVGLVIAQGAVYLLSLAIAERILKNHDINALPFRLLAAGYPFAAMYSSFVMTEAWVMLALTAIALLLSGDKVSLKQALLSGIIAGYAVLLRTDMLLLPLLMSMLVFWVNFKARRHRRELISSGLAPILGALVFLLPYSAWNAINFGKFSPTPPAAAVGSSLYLATWQELLAFEDLVALDEGVATPNATKAGLAAEVRELNGSIGAAPLTVPFNPASYPTKEAQIEANRTFGLAAIERIKAEPEPYVRHLIGNLWELWNTSRYTNVPGFAQPLLRASSWLVYVAGMLGVFLVVFRREEWMVRPQVALLMLYPFVVHIPLHTEARYTAAARPLLLMFAAMAVIWAYKRLAVPGKNDRGLHRNLGSTAGKRSA